MFQITYAKDQDRLVMRFPASAESMALARSFESASITIDGMPSGLSESQFPPTPWNQSLINKHCHPLAMTPWAKQRLEALSLPVNRVGSPIRDEAPNITDWRFYRVPFKHQIIAFKFAVDNPNVALLLDMGLGKTFVAVNVIDYFRTVRSIGKPALVVIPLSSFETWEREFKECGSDARVVSCHGSRARKIDLLQGEGDVFLITYESLKGLTEEVKKRQWGYCVLDESTKIKNAQAERAKAACEVGRVCERRMILTGYPITQSYIDIYGQYKFLDPRIFGTSFHHFRSRYCVMGGFNDKQVIGYTNIKELTEKMFSRAIRFTKAECLDLPEKTYQTYRFDLDANEKKAYDELKKQLVLQFKTGGNGDGPKITKQVTAQNALVAGLRLVQICSGYVGGVVQLDECEAPVLQDVGESKIKLLEEVLESVPDTESMIIWCRFKHNLKQIQELLTKKGISSLAFSGELSALERKAAIEAFQAGKVRAFVGIINAGGHGLNLTRASYVIYYSQDYSIERRMQSEDRAHRIGQTKNVTYVDLVARATIEESILRCLRGKKKEADVIFDFAKNPEKFLEGAE